jgi:hypothetical protein
VKPAVVALETFREAQRVIDYDGIVAAGLTVDGRESARKAFANAFPGAQGEFFEFSRN